MLTWGPESGPGLISTREFSEVFALGHWEYGKYTLAEEYERDMKRGLTNVPFPRNYFPHDDQSTAPLFSWRAHANLLWRNWLNELQVLTWGPESGPGLISTRDFSEVFALGHWEYGKYTLAVEYERDMKRGLTNVPFPRNYFPNDDPSTAPLYSWRAHANLLWRNWLNWVYQMTPYDLTEVPDLLAQGKLGTDHVVRHAPCPPREDGFRPFLDYVYGLIVR